MFVVILIVTLFVFFLPRAAWLSVPIGLGYLILKAFLLGKNGAHANPPDDRAQTDRLFEEWDNFDDFDRK